MRKELTSVSSERVLTVYTLTSECIFSILLPEISYGADKENLSNNQQSFPLFSRDSRCYFWEKFDASHSKGLKG